jgi:hypothetical protein
VRVRDHSADLALVAVAEPPAHAEATAVQPARLVDHEHVVLRGGH